MKIRTNCFILVSILTLSYCATPESLEEKAEVVKKEIKSAKDKFSLDTRVVVYDITPHFLEDGTLVLTGASNQPEVKKELLQTLEQQGYVVKDSILKVPADHLKGNLYGVVRLSACNIRSQAKHSGELATQAMLGTQLRVYEQQGGWYRVQTPDGYIGWLDKGGFTLMNETQLINWQNSQKVIYLPDFGFSLSEPKAKSQPVTDLLAGNILQLIEKKDGYAMVGYPDGRTAFVPSNEVQDWGQWINSRDPNATTILSAAKTFMGRPYLWGGTSGKGVDCSGFTKTVFYLNGVLLPRDASQQVHTGMEIPADTTLAGLQPGDLLFFCKAPDIRDRITHVAIYMGDGKIIHSTGTVKIESLKRGEPDFAEDRLLTFARAKRMFTSLGQNGVELLSESQFY